MNEDMIQNFMKELGLDENQAQELAEFDKKVDKGIIKDENLTDEQKKAIKKATNVSRSVDAYGKKRIREKKVDAPKENIIQVVKKAIEQELTQDIEITNISKTIEFNLNNEHYVIDLKRSRKK